jgi:putative transposase
MTIERLSWNLGLQTALPIPAPERKQMTTWQNSFHSGSPRGADGTVFFTVEVLTLGDWVIYYVLLFIHLESRKVEIAGITTHGPSSGRRKSLVTSPWKAAGYLETRAYLLHDRDTKYTASFLTVIEWST